MQNMSFVEYLHSSISDGVLDHCNLELMVLNWPCLLLGSHDLLLSLRIDGCICLKADDFWRKRASLIACKKDVIANLLFTKGKSPKTPQLLRYWSKQGEKQIHYDFFLALQLSKPSLTWKSSIFPQIHLEILNHTVHHVIPNVAEVN